MHQDIARLRDNIARVYFGRPDVLDRVLCCLLARGHLLIEDVPGVGKTVLATALARSIDCAFSRLQLTPDLLPSDILGVEWYNRETGELVFKRGPIFSNIVLADEINRTPPRTQSALLEAMNEGTVSVDGRVLTLEPPFMVLATQNPYDAEGTYLLPENQLDRFLMRLHLGYPTAAEEARILDERPANSPLHTLAPVITKSRLMEIQAAVDTVRVAPALREYIVAIANATRGHAELVHGLSPRASLALTQTARAAAFIRGRDHAVPDDIVDNLIPVCAHRMATRGGTGTNAAALLESILQKVPSPS